MSAFRFAFRAALGADYRQGIDCIACSADARALGDAVAAGVSAIRDGCAE